MPPKRGPLQLVQREIEEVGRQVDRLMKDVQSPEGSNDKRLCRCLELQMSAEKTLRTLLSLRKADELAPVGSYDQRKQEEEKRLKNILERLNKLFMEISPPGPSSEIESVLLKENKHHLSKNNSEGDVGEDDDKDSSEEEDDNNDDDDNDDSDDTEVEDNDRTVKPQPKPSVYTVLCDFKGEQEGDLPVQKGEVLTIIKKTADGWWLAQDKKGNKGVVPKTFLQPGSRVGDEDDDEEDSDEEDDEDELEEKEEEVREEVADGRDRMRASNWSTVRKALTQIDTTDVLSAMGAIPSGFRPSTLSKLLEEDAKFKASHFVQPELSQSQLSFKDLFLDPDSGRVRARQVRTCVCFTLWSCRMIPTPGVGVQVLSRHVCLCAFDGTRVLSNIHTVRASYNSKNLKTWSFSPRMSGILPTLLNGDCFLRCNALSPNLGVLFELGVTFLRNSTGERGDLSCGWAFLKLTDDAGNPLPNKTYELPVNGGTPYEKDVIGEITAGRRSPTGVFQQMLHARREPKLIVKLKPAKSHTRAQLSLLPDTLLYCLSCVDLLALHRQLLADTLLMDRPTMQNADLICNPVLSTFPVLLDETDLMDALRSAWLEAETSRSRAQKRDLAYLKEEFRKLYMSSVYFLLHSPSLPCYHWADPPSEEQRARVIYATLMALKIQQPTTDQSGSSEVFFDSTHSHLAFDVQELTFDLLQTAR
ncbi:nephrocystin-1 isoform X1 [Nothobranchius furzeri]|uniref:Transcript variant X1 n=1 Tax=Nothobranchius furzeri TaxID=105023 RepID=A0A9D2YGP9_NOTFU|nr:transcript variant X1 [Nothobranchius furzeri]